MAGDDSAPDAIRFAVIGNPENRRVTLFLEAVQSHYAGARAETVVLSYESLLGTPAQPDWPALLRLQPGEHLIVRVDSPGENAAVRRALLLEGGLAGAELDAQRPAGVHPAEIFAAQEWFRGFERVMQRWEAGVEAAAAAGRCSLQWMNRPSAIATLFDKRRCRAALSAAGVPMPRLLPAARSYRELRDGMSEAGVGAVFVKPVHGSSASGVVGYSARAGGAERAVTSAAPQRDGRLLNSLKIRRLDRRQDLEPLLDRLLGEGDGAVVEEWLPKLRHQGCEADVRVVTVLQQAAHMVVRKGSQCPITNLHLGNERGDAAEWRAQLPDDGCWERVQAAAEAVARCFPELLYIGVDVLVTPDGGVFVLEANAFGDLLPRIEWNGMSTYEAEVAAAMALAADFS